MRVINFGWTQLSVSSHSAVESLYDYVLQVASSWRKVAILASLFICHPDTMQEQFYQTIVLDLHTANFILGGDYIVFGLYLLASHPTKVEPFEWISQSSSQKHRSYLCVFHLQHNYVYQSCGCASSHLRCRTQYPVQGGWNRWDETKGRDQFG
jgi:hypothetical protein